MVVMIFAGVVVASAASDCVLPVGPQMNRMPLSCSS